MEGLQPLPPPDRRNILLLGSSCRWPKKLTHSNDQHRNVYFCYNGQFFGRPDSEKSQQTTHKSKRLLPERRFIRYCVVEKVTIVVGIIFDVVGHEVTVASPSNVIV